MFKSFLNHYPNHLNSILTFSDYDLGFGNVYGTLGFEMIEKPVPQKNFVHPTYTKGEGIREQNMRIKSSSLHFAGSDRLLKNFPNYVPVGMKCLCENEYHPNASCLPNNPQIVQSYGFLPIFDCGYKKWLFDVTKIEREVPVKETEEEPATLF